MLKDCSHAGVTLRLLWLAIALCWPQLCRGQMVIVVPQKSEVDSLSFKQVRQLFGAQGPAKIRNHLLQVVEYEPSSDEFYHILFGLDAYALGKRWLRLIFSGERVLAPKSCSSIRRFIDYMTTHRNTIGFLPLDVFTGVQNNALRAVPVDGLNYRQPDYALRRRSK